MTKIILINSLGTGGAQTQLMLRLKSYSKHSKCIVLYRGPFRDWGFRWLENVEFISLTSFCQGFRFLVFAREKDVQVEVWSSSLLLVGIALKALKPSVRLIVHERTVECFHSKGYRRIRNYANPLFHHITANNYSHYIYLQTVLSCKVVYLRNVVEFRPVVFDQYRLDFVIISRFSEEKRVKDALEWIAKLFPEASVNVYGATKGERGVYKDYESCLRKFYINEKTIIHGSVGRNLISLGCGNILVHFSKVEGSPNAVLEAISRCCWVILRSDSNFFEEFFRFDSVFLVSTPAEFNNAVRKIAGMRLEEAKVLLLSSKQKLDNYDQEVCGLS